MVIFRSRPLTSTDAVKREVVDLVERQKSGSPQDLTFHREEVDALLGSFSEFAPEWRSSHAVFRLARLEVGKHLPAGTPWHYRAGIIPVIDTTRLPDIKSELDTILEMLNFIRERKGLRRTKMPLFLQPDEIVDAARLGLEAETSLFPPPSIEPARGKAARPRSREKLRRAVHDRDGWKCRECAETLDLHLHRVESGSADDDPDGYVTLCRRCLVRVEGSGLRVGEAATARGFGLGEDFTLDDLTIRSQLAVVFHRGRIGWVGFVFGDRFVLLKN